MATLLSLAREARTIAPCDSLLLLATTGHEGGYGGMAAVLDSGRLPPPASVRLWVHLGAGLAACKDQARTWVEDARYLMATAGEVEAARAAFAGQPGYGTPTEVDARTVVGEGEAVLGAGYPAFVGGVSAHLYHHSPDDRADRTSGALVEPMARAFASLVAAGADRSCLLGSPSPSLGSVPASPLTGG